MSGAQHNTVCFFLRFACDVTSGWAERALVGFFLVEWEFFVCVCFGWVLILRGRSKKTALASQNAARNSSELINLFKNSLLLLETFSQETVMHLKTKCLSRSNGAISKTGLLKDKRHNNGTMFDGFSGESLLVSFSQCCSTRAMFRCCSVWFEQN